MSCNTASLPFRSCKAWLSILSSTLAVYLSTWQYHTELARMDDLILCCLGTASLLNPVTGRIQHRLTKEAKGECAMGSESFSAYNSAFSRAHTFFFLSFLLCTWEKGSAAEFDLMGKVGATKAHMGRDIEHNVACFLMPCGKSSIHRLRCLLSCK